jgi:LacI family transcriptional regulator
MEGGARAAEEILAGEKRPTGMIISNYSMTVGAIIRLNEMGISIPEDLSVIGFDNINFAKAMNPVLTIVDQPETLIAEAAAELLLKRIEAAGDEAEGARHVVIPARMVEGRSVRKIRGEEK